ncbi:MAG: response regulator [Elusimicrobiota bacterium]|nr:MAG: response regulator [Elusimicrobiota bacterium]
MKKARILVVEDDRASAELLLRLLAAKGHSARAVDNAEDAAKALAAEAFDLVLLDHVLPGATGMQSLGRLRGLSKAPIHLMSGYTGDDTRADALLLGAAGFVPKPVDFTALAALVEALPERPA